MFYFKTSSYNEVATSQELRSPALCYPPNWAIETPRHGTTLLPTPVSMFRMSLLWALRCRITQNNEKTPVTFTEPKALPPAFWIRLPQRFHRGLLCISENISQRDQLEPRKTSAVFHMISPKIDTKPNAGRICRQPAEMWHAHSLPPEKPFVPSPLVL